MARIIRNQRYLSSSCPLFYLPNLPLDVLLVCPTPHLAAISHYINADSSASSYPSLRIDLQAFDESENDTAGTCQILRHFAHRIEHDFLILEDDPYYFLYFGAAPRPPSYFALEREALPAVGRVLRFDSLSKILSAGIRIGFACGPAPIMDVIDMHVRTRYSPRLLTWADAFPKSGDCIRCVVDMS